MFNVRYFIILYYVVYSVVSSNENNISRKNYFGKRPPKYYSSYKAMKAKRKIIFNSSILITFTKTSKVYRRINDHF